jgi:uncharacterized phage-associated protein
MKSPFTGKEMKLLYEKSTWKFRGEAYEYMHASWLCSDTGERFTTDELDNASYLQVTNQYRAKYGVPFTDEIISLRRKYGLSAARMSAILGFGINQWRSYEDGEVPSVSNGRMIRSIMNPSVFLNVIDSAKHVLGESDYKKIYSKVKSEVGNEENSSIDIYNKSRLFVCERGVDNGYGIISVEKLKDVILYILQINGEVFCTKMNKLLFYIDFLSYRQTGMSLTGLSYRALPYGPVPERWDRIYSFFDEIVMEPRIIGTREGMVIMHVKNIDNTCLSDDQKGIISSVCERFNNCSSADISHISHLEDAWLNCQAENLRIPYKYAFTLLAI